MEGIDALLFSKRRSQNLAVSFRLSPAIARPATVIELAVDFQS